MEPYGNEAVGLISPSPHFPSPRHLPQLFPTSNLDDVPIEDKKAIMAAAEQEAE